MSRSRTRPSSLRIGLVTSLIAAAALVGPVAADAVPSVSLVIDEVYGGGGNSGSEYTNDFIELQNRGTAPVTLDGLSLQYTSAAGTATWQVTPLTGSVAPGAYFVVAEGKGAGGTTPVPSQLTGTIAMSATSGTIALVDNTTALGCHDSAACGAATVDLVGYGTAVINENAPAVGLDNSHSAGRLPAADTDSNAKDFIAQEPTPGLPTLVVAPPPPVEPGDTRIHDIQGTSFVSPLDGRVVTGVPGIVTAVRTAGSSRGYFVQDPRPDADPATSEGVFVFASVPTVTVGDAVLFSGKVQDYYADGAPAKARTLSVTEITNSTVFVVSHDNALPAPEVITPTTVPELYAPSLGGGNIEATPITPVRSALDFWESREGMRVEVDDARVVGPTDSYGEQYVTTKPSQKTSYRGGTLLASENATPSGRLEIAPVIANPGVSVGDVYTGAIIGPVDYSQFGGYLVAATQLGAVARGKIAPVVATTPGARQLSIATYNVENLAPTDGQSKFDALAKGIVLNLQAPDIVAVEEVQDNSGATDNAVVAADVTIKKLTDAIVAAGGPQYHSREIDPTNDKDGGQPGGNIRNVFLFDPARVSFVDAGSSTADRTVTGTAVTGSFLRPGLTLSPGRIDPGNTAWTSSRKPLVGEFRFRGLPVFVVANHFNSKGGDGNADGRFQYPTRSSEVQRQQQATLVHQFVQQILRRNPLAQTVVLGDLNDYQFSPALQVLRTGTADGSGRPVLVDLIATLPADQQYTYVYQGISQILDHILVTPGTYLTGSVDYQVIHINSEFANQTSDHDPQVVRLFGSYR